MQVSIRRQATDKEFEREPGCLVCVVASVVGGSEDLTIGVRRDAISQAHISVIIRSGVHLRGVETLIRNCRTRGRRIERGGVLGNVLNAATDADSVLEALMTREVRDLDGGDTVFLRTEISALSQRKETADSCRSACR